MLPPRCYLSRSVKPAFIPLIKGNFLVVKLCRLPDLAVLNGFIDHGRDLGSYQEAYAGKHKIAKHRLVVRAIVAPDTQVGAAQEEHRPGNGKADLRIALAFCIEQQQVELITVDLGIALQHHLKGLAVGNVAVVVADVVIVDDKPARTVTVDRRRGLFGDLKARFRFAVLIHNALHP